MSTWSLVSDDWGRSLLDLVTTLKELHAVGVNFVSLNDSLDFTTLGRPWQKSRATMCRGIAPGPRRRDDAVLIEIRASLDNEGSGARTQTAAARLPPLAANGQAMAGMLAVFAQYERDILRDRVRVGIAEARKNGKPHGRPATAKALADDARRLFLSGVSKSQIAKRLGIGRTSVRRLVQNVGP
jgi:DNA invertase Pin-like site-specific DNA recombinase